MFTNRNLAKTPIEKNRNKDSMGTAAEDILINHTDSLYVHAPAEVPMHSTTKASSMTSNPISRYLDASGFFDRYDLNMMTNAANKVKRESTVK